MYLRSFGFRLSISLSRKHSENLLILSVTDNIGQKILNINGRAALMGEVEGDFVCLSGQRNGSVMSGKTFPKFVDECRNDCLRAERYQKRRSPARRRRCNF